MRSVLLFGLAIFMMGMILQFQGTVTAQDGSTPTPAGVSPVIRAGMEQTEIQIEQLREVPAPQELQRRVLTTEELLQNAQSQTMQRYSEQDALVDAVFYESFGFIPNTIDLYMTVESLVTATPAGYYDDANNTIYMLNTGIDLLDPFSSIVYGRNYALAIQDAHSDIFIQREAAIVSGDWDRAMALNAVIEGDAQLTTQLYVQYLIESGAISVESMLDLTGRNVTTFDAALPSILISELLFPADAGTQFVRDLYNETNTWRLVNLLYERLPLSTEHILHPNLYLLYEPPQVVELVPLETFWQSQNLDSDAWQLVTQRSLGEFYLREHLSLFFDTETVDAMASGWGGDQFMIYQNNRAERALVWRLSWDSEQDFREFAAQYPDYLNQWLAVLPQTLPNGAQCWLAGIRNTCMITFQQDILIVQAPTSDLANLMLNYELQQLASTRIFG